MQIVFSSCKYTITWEDIAYNNNNKVKTVTSIL